MNTAETQENLVFDHHTIRLLIGIIAFFFPWIVSLRAGEITRSISASYHTDARDFFVGLLFVLGAFMMSYKGHKDNPAENWVAKAGGFAAWVTALFPTTPSGGEISQSSQLNPLIHNFGAVILFATTIYFCLFAFRTRARKKREGKIVSASGGIEERRRMLIYSACGWGILIVMVGTIVAKIWFSEVGNLVFWTETIALTLFGIAWMFAGGYIYLSYFVEEGELQRPFGLQQ
jgi:hypothetical protein